MTSPTQAIKRYEPKTSEEENRYLGMEPLEDGDYIKVSDLNGDAIKAGIAAIDVLIWQKKTWIKENPQDYWAAVTLTELANISKLEAAHALPAAMRDDLCRVCNDSTDTAMRGVRELPAPSSYDCARQ